MAMNFPGSRLSLDPIDLRTPGNDIGSAAGLVNLGATFGTLQRNKPDFVGLMAANIGVNASLEAEQKRLEAKLKVAQYQNDVTKEIAQQKMDMMTDAAQEKADEANASSIGSLAGAGVAAAGLAAGVVGPLAIPIGIAAGGGLGKLFG